MAKAVQVDVAEAVKNILKTNKFGHTYEPERSYADWDMELDKETGTLVDIVPAAVKQELLTAGQNSREVSVDVGVRRKFSSDEHSQGRIDLAEIDKLVKLLEDIGDYFADPDNRRLNGYEAAVWNRTEITTYAPKDHLKRGQFTGIVRITFDVHESL